MSDQRVTVVTGGSSGIGRATARRFARDGDLVVIADINEKGGQLVVDAIAAGGGEAEFRFVDVAEEESVNTLAEGVKRDFGPATALVNCAGILQNPTDIGTFDLEEHDRVWRINYRGTYLCCRAFSAAMSAAGGTIINISSTSAIAAYPLHAYAPGKAAIDWLTQMLAAELGPKGIRINSVMPGYVLTEQMKSRIDAGLRNPKVMEQQSALGRMVMPEEVADSIHFLCSDAARAITGVVLRIDAGWHSTVLYRQFPGFATAT